MESMDYWRLCDELSIVQAAHLLIGLPPGTVEAMAQVGNELLPSSHATYVTDLNAAMTAITNAFRRGSIDGKLIPIYEYGFNGNQLDELPDSIDTKNSRVNVESLKKWLQSRGLKSGFFFPESPDTPDYLDPSNPRYAAKLAAAVRAWQAVTDTGSKSPKQALDKWLREHAAEFQMTDDEGKLVNQAIEECSKIANWRPGGGAPKTPGKKPTRPRKP